MNKKRAADTVILLIFAAILLIAGIYREQIEKSFQIMCISCVGMVLFFLLALRDREKFPQQERVQKTDNKVLKEAVLLSEEDTELMVWDLYGRTAMVIGREGKENQVDIDLRKSPYASMVDGEHAVLNFSAGQWFVEGCCSGRRENRQGRIRNEQQSDPVPERAPVFGKEIWDGMPLL